MAGRLAHIPLVANIYLELFEEQTLSTAPQPPSLWLRYVDDTFTVRNEYDVDEFTEHVNNIDPHTEFTIEPEKDKQLPLLDLCMHILDDSSTKLTTHRKPTHTDQYLNFKSHHPLMHKIPTWHSNVSSFGELGTIIWSNKSLPLRTKLKVYNVCVLSILLHGAETWTT